MSKREEFHKQSSTAVEYRNKVVDYFLKYSHNTSWSDVSSLLYGSEHDEAVEEARKFIKGTSGESSLILVHFLHFDLILLGNRGRYRTSWERGA